jgi:hypothetical protein
MTQEEQANDVSWIDSPVKDREVKVQSKVNISTLQDGSRKGVRPPRIKFGQTHDKVEIRRNDLSSEKISTENKISEITLIDRSKGVDSVINNENTSLIATNKLGTSDATNSHEAHAKYTQISSSAKLNDEVHIPILAKSGGSPQSPLKSISIANGKGLTGLAASSIVSKPSPHSIPDDVLMQIDIPLSDKLLTQSNERDNKVLSDVSDDALMKIDIPINCGENIQAGMGKTMTKQIIAQPFVSDEVLMELVRDDDALKKCDFNQTITATEVQEISDDALLGIEVNSTNVFQSLSKCQTVATGEVSDDFLMQLDVEVSHKNAVKPNLCGSHIASTENNESVTCFRFVALDIHDDANSNRKEIRCFKEDTYCRTFGDINNHIFRVILTEDWYYTEINEGDLFHVVDLKYSCVDDAMSTYDPNGLKFQHVDDVITLTNQFGLLVMHPDIMLSPTRISEVSSCLRKSVISERVRVFESSNPAVLGNTRHMFVELVMAACFNRLQGLNLANINASMLITEKEMQEIMNECIKKYLLDLHVTGFTDDTIKAKLREIFECIVQWIKQSFVHGASSIRKDDHGFKAEIVPEICYTLKQMISAEESIWSPSLGIKGQIDIITKSRLEKVVGNDLAQHIGKNFVVPVELKTGT